MNTCSLGGETEFVPSSDPSLDCTCDASCEPHRHEDGEVVCLHDGETDHSHCPQSPWRIEE